MFDEDQVALYVNPDAFDEWLASFPSDYLFDGADGATCPIGLWTDQVFGGGSPYSIVACGHWVARYYDQAALVGPMDPAAALDLLDRIMQGES